MDTLASFLLTVLAALLVIPVAIFFVEIVAAVAMPHRGKPLAGTFGPRQRLAVVIPAHNESTAVLATLNDVRAQLLPADRLLVVADNCTDDTAVIAAAAGAEVIKRDDPVKRGKGYALDFALQHLKSDPPEIVVIIDADCRLTEHTLDRLATACAISHRPVQALDLMIAPDGEQINHSVAEFAWRVKNWIRPLGLSALGLPCQLLGTGMAIPWNVIGRADVGTGWIVEDLKLGLDLASSGHPPLFCPSACVTSRFPVSAAGAETQRQRWEQGHILTIFKAAPGLLVSAIARRNWYLLALTLDLAVPPLSLLAVLVLGSFLVTGLAALFGISPTAFYVSTASLLAFAAAGVLSWLKCGRDILPSGSILAIPNYAFRKVPLYCNILVNRIEAQWIRTDRTKSEDE